MFSTWLKSQICKAGLLLAPLFSGSAAQAVTFDVTGPHYLGDGIGGGSLVSGDFNADGLSDIAFNYNNQKIIVLVQSSTGQLTAYYDAPLWLSNTIDLFNHCILRVGDLNNDGVSDLMISHTAGLVSLVSTSDEERFHREELPLEWSSGLGVARVTALIDADEDSDLDVIAIKGDWSLRLWVNDGTGVLGSESTIGDIEGEHLQLHMEVGDINSDGRNDVVIPTSQLVGETFVSRIDVFENHGLGKFLKRKSLFLPLGANVHKVAIGDVTGDERNDLVLSHTANSPGGAIVVLPQLSNGEFGQYQSYGAYDLPQSVVIGDMNEDGLNDVLVNHPGWMSVSLYLQASPMLTFASRIESFWNNYGDPQGVAIGDFNSDGCNDFAVADAGAYFMARRSNCPVVDNIFTDGFQFP